MAPKRDLATLKVKEVAMATHESNNWKMSATIPAEEQELHRFKRGQCQDTLTMVA